MIDLDAIQSRLDRGVESLTDTYDLLREVERLRGEAERDRAAAVAWLRKGAQASAQTLTANAGEWAKLIGGRANCIERGLHRREEDE